MIKPTEKEQEYIDEMLDIKRQIYLADSWKRQNDLERCLKRLEKEWKTYKISKYNLTQKTA